MGALSASRTHRYEATIHIPTDKQMLIIILLKYLICIVNVHMPRDRITQLHQNYGFVEFMGEDDADYAIKIMNMIKIYGKPIRVNKVTNV